MQRRRYPFSIAALVTCIAPVGGCGGDGGSNAATMPAAPDAAVVALKTATPIKHVIIIVGENRSFDHIFATYAPVHPNEAVGNLLSQQIINSDGTPGPNFPKAHQYRINSAPNAGKYFSSADLKDKTLYSTLPPPDVNEVTATPPAVGVLSIPGGDPGLPKRRASRSAGMAGA